MSLDLTLEEKVLIAVAKNNPVYQSVIRKVLKQVNDNLRAISDATPVSQVSIWLPLNKAAADINDAIKALT
jgi:hypothetical protein